MLASALLKQLGAAETNWSPDIWSLFYCLKTLLTLNAGIDDEGMSIACWTLLAELAQPTTETKSTEF